MDIYDKHCYIEGKCCFLSQLLVTVMLVPNGPTKVMQAFDQFRIVANEQKKFQRIVLSLTDEPIDHTYQVKIICYLHVITCRE